MIIGHVGKFLAVKNHSFLVRFFNFLVENNYNAELHFYGEGPMEKEVKEMAISYNIYDKVFFHGLKKILTKFIMNLIVLSFHHSMKDCHLF
nr:glycosyltransferase [Globicatella sp. PHS-GS-PNBC-21-1553]